MAQPQMMQPPQIQQMHTGLEFSVNYDALFLHQKRELFEAITGCDTKNRYHLVGMPHGLPDPVPEVTINQFKEMSRATPLLKGKEESDCLERVCCPHFRSFKMPFVDGSGQTYFTVDRPFKFTCLCLGCCMCNNQELQLLDIQGRPIAKAREEFKMCWCCTRTFEAMDANGNVQYKLRVPECGSSQGTNCCAPSCCNGTFVVDIYDAAEQRLLGTSASVWPGCNCGGLTERSNLVVRFPEGASPTPVHRAAMLAGMFLVEYAVFEWKRQQGEGGGGGGG